MNEIVNKFLSAGDKFMPEMHLRHDMAYGDFKDLTRRTVSDKILCGKAFNIAKNLKYDRYKCGFLQWFINFFIKKLQVEQVKMKIFLIKN